MKKTPQGMERRTGGRGNDTINGDGIALYGDNDAINTWQFEHDAANDAEGRVAA